MAIDLSEHGKGYQDLKEHINHQVAVVGYGNPQDPYGVAIECESCGEILVDFPEPEVED